MTMSIRQVVMWKLRDAADAPKFKALLDSCIGLVPGMLQYEAATRSEGLAASVDVVLVSLFRDAAALEAYQTHPTHQAVAAQLGPMRESRSVLDYSVAEAG